MLVLALPKPVFIAHSTFIHLLQYTEAFVVCKKYHLPDGFVPTMANPLLDHNYGKIIQ